MTGLFWTLTGNPNMRVLTDHKSLVFFKTQNAVATQQAKWIELLEELNLKIHYKKGSELVTANALSQLC